MKFFSCAARQYANNCYLRSASNQELECLQVASKSLRGEEVFSIPRIGMLRTIMLNHWYHHRGQLAVYLRLLEVPVPVIYGRSADEDPFK